MDETKSKTFTNNQTRHIANDLDYTKLNNSNNFLLEEYEQFVNPILNNDELITLAKKRLSEFAFIGLTEKTTESLLLFCYTFNLKPLGNFWNLMVAPKRTPFISLDTDTKNNLKKCNNLDLQLYEFAQELFDFRFSRMLDDLCNFSDFDLNDNELFQSKLFEFLDFNHKTYLKNQCLELSTIDYDFSGQFNGGGWHYRELYSNPPNYFRWTGPSKTSTFDFILLFDVDYKIELSVIDFVSEEQLNSFQFFVNDNLIDLKITPDNNSTIFTGTIPKFLISKKDVTCLTFRISKTLKTNSSTLALSDSRMCGLAFDNIKIYLKK